MSACRILPRPGTNTNRRQMTIAPRTGRKGDQDMSTVKLRIGPTDHGRAMSLDEFREAEEQPGYLYELARGVLEVVEVPRDEHGQIVDNLHEAISTYRRRHRGRIRRIAHGSDIRLIIPEL